MCPTEYNKSWSNPKGNYLTTLGEKLNPSVQIMWTGDRVISDITRDGISGLTNALNVPPTFGGIFRYPIMYATIYCSDLFMATTPQ